MEVLDFTIYYEPGEVFHLSNFSDVHEDAEQHDTEDFEAALVRRSKLGNPLFYFNGDTMNLIWHRDEKRYVASETASTLITRDDFVNGVLNRCITRLAPYAPYILGVGMGNHEFEFTKRHGVDPVALLVRELNNRNSPARWGGYSGYLRLKFCNKTAKYPGKSPVIYSQLYHHGKWLGQTLGKMGFERWANSFECWDLATCGHIHETAAWESTRLRPGRVSGIKARTVYFLETGCYLRAYSKSGNLPDYAEKNAMLPKFIGSPLIRLTPPSDNNAPIKIELILGKEV